jgi:hypothetical protein
MEVYAQLQVYASISLTDFWELTPIDVHAICNRVSERDQEQHKVLLANIRNMIFRLWRIQIKEQVTDPREYYTLWWEDEFDDEKIKDLLNTDWELMDYLYKKN